MSPSSTSWEDRFVERIASEIRRLRTVKGMSAQVLADKINELGHAMSRSTLADIENGRRKFITVTELIVFARALDAAPIMLMFPGPYTHDKPTEALPGVSGYELEVVEWFCGEGTANEQGITNDELQYLGNCRALRDARRLKETKEEKIGLEWGIRSAIERGDDAQVELYSTLLSNVNRKLVEAELVEAELVKAERVEAELAKAEGDAG